MATPTHNPQHAVISSCLAPLSKINEPLCTLSNNQYKYKLLSLSPSYYCYYYYYIMIERDLIEKNENDIIHWSRFVSFTRSFHFRGNLLQFVVVAEGKQKHREKEKMSVLRCFRLRRCVAAFLHCFVVLVNDILNFCIEQFKCFATNNNNMFVSLLFVTPINNTKMT